MKTSHSDQIVSRRTALAGLGAGGLGLALATRSLSASAQDATPSQATPDPSATGVDLIRTTERKRLRALVEADVDIALQLHTDDFQLINPAGGTLSKEEYLGSITSGEIDYLVFEPVSEIAVRFYGEAAVIRYRSNLQIVLGGQDLGLANFWHTDSYELRDGSWQAVWSQATAIQ